MTKILIFLIFLNVFHSGRPLSCYKCNGCESTSTLKEICRNVDPETQDAACLTQKLRTGGTIEAMVIKKCVVFEKDKNFVCPTLPTGETVSCQKCQTDFCNSGMKITTNFYLFWGICLTLSFSKILSN